MRVSGLATGMDTENIINKLMEAQRIPLDKITHKKQQLEWKLEDYRDINRDLKKMEYNLRDTVNRQSSYSAKTVTVSNADAVGVKSINSTADFSGSIEVHRLATNARLQSAGKLVAQDPDKVITKNSKLSELVGDSQVANFSMTINAPGMKDPVTLEFTKEDSIDSVMKRINEKTGVNAFFDEQSGKVALSAKNSGVVDGLSTIVISNGENPDHGDLAGILKLDGSNPTAVTAGQNADITFNGLRTQRDSNTFQINGFEINLKQVTSPYKTPLEPGVIIDPEAPPEVVTTGAVTFSSTADVDKVMDTVVKFVDDYNKLIEDLNAQIRESVNRNFHPLSAEQKKEMSEKEVELWEEKAKSGALKNDPAITSMLTKLRSIMNDEVGGVRLSDFGITPTRDYLSHGKLEIDESKLREKIAEDPNKLYELIGNPTADSKGKVGLSHQFRVEIENTHKIIGKRAGSAGAVNDTFTLGKNIKDMNSQIEKFESRLQMVESRLWKQFNAMESAIQRMNAQSANLMSQFGG